MMLAQVSADGSAFPIFYAIVAFALAALLVVGWAVWKLWRKQ